MVANISKRKALRRVWQWLPIKSIVAGLIVAVIGGLIVLFIWSKFAGDVKDNGVSTENSSSVQVDTAAATLTLKALENWLWEFDRKTTDSLELIMGEMNSRGMLEAGESKTRIAHFRESRRRSRVSVRDSFCLAYSIQGGDTTKLNHKQ